jgi:hypothetical protein
MKQNHSLSRVTLAWSGRMMSAATLGIPAAGSPSLEQLEARLGMLRYRGFDVRPKLAKDGSIIPGVFVGIDAAVEGPDTVHVTGTRDECIDSLSDWNRVFNGFSVRTGGLYIEVIEKDGARPAQWVRVELTEQLLGKVILMRQLCVDNALASVQMYDRPDVVWADEATWRPELQSMHISRDSLWFSSVAHGSAGIVESLPVPIDALVQMMSSAAPRPEEARKMEWVNSDLYFDSSNAQGLADQVADDEHRPHLQ